MVVACCLYYAFQMRCNLVHIGNLQGGQTCVNFMEHRISPTVMLKEAIVRFLAPWASFVVTTLVPEHGGSSLPVFVLK